MSSATPQADGFSTSSISWLALAVLLLLLALPVMVWVSIHGSPLDYRQPGIPAGQGLYAFSKLLALLAIIILGFQVVLGLLRKRASSSPMTQAAIRYHKVFGILVTLLVISHVLLFVAAVSLRNGHLAFAVLVPRPFAGFYELGLSLGILGFVLLLTLSVSGFLVSRGKTLGRYLHRLYLPTFLLIVLHGWCIGSEGRLTMMVMVVGLLLFAVLALMLTARKPNGKIARLLQRFRHRQVS